MTAGLLFFGLMMWKKPEKVAAGLKYDKHTRHVSPESYARVKAAYLHQVRAVGLGLFMGGFACAALFFVWGLR